TARAADLCAGRRCQFGAASRIAANANTHAGLWHFRILLRGDGALSRGALWRGPTLYRGQLYARIDRSRGTRRHASKRRQGWRPWHAVGRLPDCASEQPAQFHGCLEALSTCCAGTHHHPCRLRLCRAPEDGMSERLTTSVELARSDAPSWSVRAWLDRFGMVLIVPALLGMGGIVSPAFVSLDNLSNLLLQFAPLAIVAMGQALVMIVRGLDLSV